MILYGLKLGSYHRISSDTIRVEILCRTPCISSEQTILLFVYVVQKADRCWQHLEPSSKLDYFSVSKNAYANTKKKKKSLVLLRSSILPPCLGLEHDGMSTNECGGGWLGW